MANVEITENTIIRSLVRKGTNEQRRQIVLEEGELGYTTDTERLFIGNGQGTGIAAGVKYLGTYSDFSEVAATSPMPGDFFVFEGNVYARKTEFEGSASAETLSAFSLESGYDQIGLAASAGQGLEVNNGALNVKPDDETITLTFDNKLKVNNVSFNNLESIHSLCLLGNDTNSEAPTNQIPVNQNSVIGRKDNNVLTNITFNDIVTLGNGAYTADNSYADSTIQTSANFNSDYSGKITWAGVPHLAVFDTPGASSFAIPDNCHILKVTLVGAGCSGITGTQAGGAGGSLVFYVKVSSDSSLRAINLYVGDTKEQIAEGSWITFYDTSNTLREFAAVGGYAAPQVAPVNTVPSGVALGDVIDVKAGGSLQFLAAGRTPSLFGAMGYGSGGAAFTEFNDQGKTGKSGVVIIEYSKPL